MKSVYSVGFRPYGGTPWMGEAGSGTLLTQFERNKILSEIATGTAVRNEIADWWDRTLNVRELLGADMAAYSQALTQAMSLEETVRTVDGRLKESGPAGWTVTPAQVADIEAWSSAVDRLAEIVSRRDPSIAGPMEKAGAPKEDAKLMVVAAGIGIAALGAAFLV